MRLRREGGEEAVYNEALVMSMGDYLWNDILL